MDTRVRSLVVFALALGLSPLPAGAQDADKVLVNLKGSVAYEHDGTSHALVPSVRHSLIDNDYASTQNASQAQVTLPDSSIITLGSDTRVQMAFFNQTDIANAKFIVYQGKTRFQVQHPAGAQSNYVFTTPTSSIAVRGTEGDIDVDGNDLTLNVYNSNTAGAPVEVTFTTGDKAGTTVKVLPGQSLIAHLVNGVIQTQIGAITQAALDRFSELGVPTNVQQVQNTVVNKIRSAVHLPF